MFPKGKRLIWWFVVPALISFSIVGYKPFVAWLTWWRIEREATVAAQEGHLLKAVSLYEKGVKHYPNDGTFKLRLAKLYQRQGRLKEATSLFQRGFRQQHTPTLTDRLNYARLLAHQKQWNDAVNQYRQALHEHGKNRTSFYELGHFYQQAAQEAQEKGYTQSRSFLLNNAQYYLKETLKLAPDYEPALFSLGTVYLAQRDWGRAVKQFCDVIVSNPQHDQARYQVGYALTQMGYPGLGGDTMQQAIAQMDDSLKQRENSEKVAFDEAQLETIDLLKSHYLQWRQSYYSSSQPKQGLNPADLPEGCLKAKDAENAG